MEQVYQFVDDVIEGRRNDFCAIADDIWDHPETRFRSSGPPRVWPMRWKRKVFN
jgi:hypothetical protein